MRARHRDAFLKKHNLKLGFMSAFVKASAFALQEQPVVNAGEFVVARITEVLGSMSMNTDLLQHTHTHKDGGQQTKAFYFMSVQTWVSSPGNSWLTFLKWLPNYFLPTSWTEQFLFPVDSFAAALATGSPEPAQLSRLHIVKVEAHVLASTCPLINPNILGPDFPTRQGSRVTFDFWSLELIGRSWAWPFFHGLGAHFPYF